MHAIATVSAAALAAVLVLPWPPVEVTISPEGQGDSGTRVRILDAPDRIPAFSRFEATFDVDSGSEALQWPYDADPPDGIEPGAGISVDVLFVDPSGREYRQPAFYYQYFIDDVRSGRDWNYPTDRFAWKVRFTPDRTGIWRYTILVQDQAGTVETSLRDFTVTPSESRGFLKVSDADPRYFEFEDGTLFTGLGLQIPEHLDDPVTAGESEYAELERHGVNFARLWISSLYGSAWTPYVGGRNRYNGYLPVTGLEPYRGEEGGETDLALRIDYEPEGDRGWYDACRLDWWNNPDSVKPNTNYRVRATFQARGITGPRNPRSPDFGFVLKLGGMFTDCHEPGTSRPVTNYGRDTSGWETVEGVWNSRNRTFLPKLHLALENADQGRVYVRSVSIREVFDDGSEGPEILPRPLMAVHKYFPQAPSHAFDQVVEAAERHGVYLKLVVMEKSDEVYLKLRDEGGFVTDSDNRDGFYGTGRDMNQTRWLQRAWWRYLQARWGYSPSIHSWELTNEGDPASRRHYELADEFGKYMHYGVFGVEPDAGFDHPNDHMVTTSFWHSMPTDEFWANPRYPHIDYADMHAYVSTSFAPDAERARMQWDAARYHIWHSQYAAAAQPGMPVVRGEAGLDSPARQDEQVLRLQRDREGIWLHNFLWSTLHSGGLYELYWWRSHVRTREYDHRGKFGVFQRFLSDLTLNRGGFEDWAGTVSSPDIRVVGQKNVTAGMMHLWIQNVAHTWKNVVDRVPIPPANGTVVVPGFRSRAEYRVEWWDTGPVDDPVFRRHVVQADEAGTIQFDIDSLNTDVALKLNPFAAASGSHATPQAQNGAEE